MVHKHKAKPGFNAARYRQIKPRLMLFRLKRRTINGDQDFRAGFTECFGNGGEPPILANHQAKAKAAKGNGARRGAGIEHALVVKHAVIGQFMLGTARGDLPGFQQKQRVEDLLTFAPRAAHHQARAAIGGLGGQGSDFGFAGGDEGGLAHQIFRRIAGDGEFRRHHKIGAKPRGFRAGLSDQRRIGGQCALMGVELRQGNFQGLGHEGLLELFSGG